MIKTITLVNTLALMIVALKGVFPYYGYNEMGVYKLTATPSFPLRLYVTYQP